MKPIIFARVADMKYYKGVTERDVPINGGSFVKETNMAHECFNFYPVQIDEEKDICLGYVQLIGGTKNGEIQLHIENIAGCELQKGQDEIDGVTVVWCSKARNSDTIRVVGFYKNATAYRYPKYAEFEEGDLQEFRFKAKKGDCVLLPYKERHSGNKWYVPVSGKRNSEFGFGRSGVWYAGSNAESVNEIAYVEKMLENIDNYNGENWIDKGGEQ